MYVLVKNGVVVKYPYSIGQLRKDNPNVSFPKDIGDAILESFGVVSVKPSPIPNTDYTKNISEGSPVYKNGWVQTWNVIDATESEIASRLDGMANAVRAERDLKLSECDWTQVADAPVNKEEWAEYRQALRDIPEQENFPVSVVWPTSPG